MIQPSASKQLGKILCDAVPPENRKIVAAYLRMVTGAKEVVEIARVMADELDPEGLPRRAYPLPQKGRHIKQTKGHEG